ncbi:MAG: tryptophan 7-halogenase [Woeseiaceae bacterium]|nr:tryptophan 7-halogenase [Woeseiaceae bacterium]
MDGKRIQSIVIVGGGTAGWMTAAALSRVLDARTCRIRLVESEQIGTVGVGEATIPAIHDFNRRIGIDEKDCMRETSATFKLGIEFVDWRRTGDAYMHPFGTYGQNINGVGFHHYWLKERATGNPVEFADFCLAKVAAKSGKFAYPSEDSRSIYSNYSYAFHFDASLYAQFLRGFAEGLGVERIEGKVVDVSLKPENGHIEKVSLEDGRDIDGELFIDCSGFRGLLIEQALGTGFESWQQWLLCDRAVAAPSANTGALSPYTRATAHSAGWQWRIPLQHRTGNGHVYSSRHVSDDEAASVLLEHIDGEPLADPRVIRFQPGKRERMWNKNCVAIGLSGGFLEPLESTSIFLIQAAIMKLIEFFPDADFAAPDIAEFNRSMDSMFNEVRDFIILHYKATERRDSEFWRYCSDMPIPPELAHRMELFRRRGVASHRQGELFIETNWIAVYLGQGIIPETYDPRADRADSTLVSRNMRAMREYVAKAAESMPSHEQTIADSGITASGAVS